MDMRFIIVEGDEPIFNDEEFEQFRMDYLTSNLSTDEVRIKYNLSKKQYSKMTKKIRDEMGIRCRPYSRAKHFYKHNGSWYVIKTINKERIYYGSLPCRCFTKMDMVAIVTEMAKMGWEYTQCSNFLEKLKVEACFL